MRRRFALAFRVGLLLVSSAGLAAAAPESRGDRWLTDTNALLPEIGSSVVDSNRFASLRAEVLGGRLRIVLPVDGFSTNARVSLHLSTDQPGHWPARDWESIPMPRGERQFESVARVTEVDVPLVYFVSVSAPSPLNGERAGVRGEHADHALKTARLDPSEPAAGGSISNTLVSPLRVCRPAAVGLEAPSHPFWPYLEGFENGLASWRLLTPETPPITADPAARSGRFALRVHLPAGRNAVSIATTRVRGWHLTLRNAAGVRFWMRTQSGEVRARFTALANAGTPRQSVAVFPKQERIGPQWGAVDLWFADLPAWNSGALDSLAIEFIGEGPREIFIDDLQLLGRWRLEP